MSVAIALLIWSIHAHAHASTNVACAQSELSKIYTAERAYFAEKREYAEDFAEIGYDPNFSAEETSGRAPASVSCTDWEFSIDRVERPGKFTASAHSRATGEEYTIDESKKINKR